MLVLLIFGVIPALWVTVEHLRGKSQIAEVKRSLESRGEPLDLARLLPPAVPWSSNGMSRLLGGSRRLKDLTLEMPLAITFLAPGRFIPGARIEWWENHSTGASNTWNDVKKTLVQHSDDLAQIRTAVGLPYRRADYDISKGFASMQLTHLSAIKTCTTALGIAATDAARRGDLDQVLSDFKAMRVLEADLRMEPMIISQLVRVACGSIANGHGWSVLHARRWDEAQLARLQKVFEPLNAVDDMVHSLEGERAGAWQSISHMTAKEIAMEWSGDWMAQAMSGGPAPLVVPTTAAEVGDVVGSLMDRLSQGVLERVVIPVWSFGWKDQAMAYYMERLDEMIAVHREAAREDSFVRLKALDWDSAMGTSSGYSRLKTVFARSSLEIFAKAALKAFRLETERALHETGTALKRFQLRRQRLPITLDELVPEFLSAVPLDRMDGKPLKYRRDSDTDFTLWSIGEDLRDDDGDSRMPADRAKAPNPQWWTAQDAVWPQEVTEIQIDDWQRRQAEKLFEKSRIGGPKNPRGLSAALRERYGLKLPGAAVSTNRGPGR